MELAHPPFAYVLSVDEDAPDDLNKDGVITMMRVKDPRGRPRLQHLTVAHDDEVVGDLPHDRFDLCEIVRGGGPCTHDSGDGDGGQDCGDVVAECGQQSEDDDPVTINVWRPVETVLTSAARLAWPVLRSVQLPVLESGTVGSGGANPVMILGCDVTVPLPPLLSHRLRHQCDNSACHL